MGKSVVLNALPHSSGKYYSEQFRRDHEIRFNHYKATMTKDQLIKEIKDVDAVVAAGEPYTREVYEAAKKLKIIARYGVGYDRVDIPEATKYGIFVTNQPGVNSETVAEHAVALIFALARGLVGSVKSTIPETWEKIQYAYYSDKVGFELHGKNLGIIGLGSIGSKVAKICSSLNMKIFAFDPYVREENDMQLGVKLTSLEELLKESDVVTIHTPLNNDTRHLIGEKQLKMMKKTAILVNAARGPIIDEKALYVALKEKWIAAAGLDVLEMEPPEPNNPLFGLDNAIITPHLAGSSSDNFMRSDALTEEQIKQALRGEVPKFALNPDAIKNRKKQY
jgi:D-3-phosphoglycerate dehydrogenase